MTSSPGTPVGRGRPSSSTMQSSTLGAALLHRWREEAEQAGHKIKRIAVAFEAGRDGFWLARWLRARDIEVHVIHASSVAVSREHRRAKTDRLDTELLNERHHCKMVA